MDGRLEFIEPETVRDLQAKVTLVHYPYGSLIRRDSCHACYTPIEKGALYSEVWVYLFPHNDASKVSGCHIGHFYIHQECAKRVEEGAVKIPS